MECTNQQTGSGGTHWERPLPSSDLLIGDDADAADDRRRRKACPSLPARAGVGGAMSPGTSASPPPGGDSSQ